MSFLGGLDLGTPEDRAGQALTRDLELQRELWRPASAQVPPLYRGSADLVLKHGKLRVGRPTPDGYQQFFSPEGQCFENASVAAISDPSLTYCQGYCTLGRGTPWLHAWCIGPDDGVVETRYSPGIGTPGVPELPVLDYPHWAYYGVTFTAEYVVAHAELTDGGVILERLPAELADLRGRWHPDEIGLLDNYPVLTRTYDPNRTAP
jgi:hypothetical protein